MTTLHSLLVTTHIVVGAIALVLFWVPVLAKKGGALHVRAGRIYLFAMYTVSITAFLASIMVLHDPLGIRRPGELLEAEQAAELAQRYRMYSLFLLMLSVLVFSSLRHGIAALRERHSPGLLASTGHRIQIGILAALALLVGALGLRYGALLLIIFGGVALSGAIGMIRDSLQKEWQQRELIIAHFGGVLGSGIGAYTAFFAFGGARFFQDLLPGQWQVVPWVLPSIVGTWAIARLSRRYRNRGTPEPHSA